ncbi:hypothetical protein XU18_3107 [Perkinsela sp. CCAP 1560/4]|nr:hypothetical protein XU18_3107 [Perkinsela sp. CCAP 1560/4]|eukprot:KNH05945.1 hypothetical protein XU18_3107 [Perkinsela sp. CCAP 1560/4]
MRNSCKSLAPAKGPLMRRVLHPDFLGINWTKVCWGTPFNSCYPHTISGGQVNRLWSNPVSFGFFPNRMSRIHLRQFLLCTPAMVLLMVMVLQPDLWAIFSGTKFVCDELGIPCEIPEPILEMRRQDNHHMARNKPGAHLKHRYGGQVSIPGSDDWM